jgi:hypothetical protein
MLGLSIFLPLASTVFTALQNAYTFSSKKLLCSAMVWSLSSPMVLASNWLIKPIEITKNNKKVLEIFIG